ARNGPRRFCGDTVGGTRDKGEAEDCSEGDEGKLRHGVTPWWIGGILWPEWHAPEWRCANSIGQIRSAPVTQHSARSRHAHDPLHCTRNLRHREWLLHNFTPRTAEKLCSVRF